MSAGTSQQDLEARVSQLETQVKRLVELLAARPSPAERRSNWQQAVGFLGADPGMKRILREAEKYREKSRPQPRKRATKSQRAKS